MYEFWLKKYKHHASICIYKYVILFILVSMCSRCTHAMLEIYPIFNYVLEMKLFGHKHFQDSSTSWVDLVCCLSFLFGVFTYNFMINWPILIKNVSLFEWFSRVIYFYEYLIIILPTSKFIWNYVKFTRNYF